MGKKGFTLIEIIIVIVILGVLATLAMPRLAAQVEGANAAEAMNMFGTIKSAIMNCYDMTSDAAACNTSGEVSVSVPTTGTKFIYGSNNPGTPTTPIWIKAVKNTGATAWNQACNTTNPCIYMAVNPVQALSSFTVDPAGSTNPYYGIVSKTGTQNPGVVVAATQAF